MKQHEDCVMWTGILGNPGNHIPPESVESKVVAADNFSMGRGLSSRENVTIMYRKERTRVTVSKYRGLGIYSMNKTGRKEKKMLIMSALAAS